MKKLTYTGSSKPILRIIEAVNALIDGGGGGGGGSNVSVTPILQSGTHIADIEVDGNTSELYAPSGGGECNILYGTVAPTSAIGSDGQIYIQWTGSTELISCDGVIIPKFPELGAYKNIWVQQRDGGAYRFIASQYYPAYNSANNRIVYPSGATERDYRQSSVGANSWTLYGEGAWYFDLSSHGVEWSNIDIFYNSYPPIQIFNKGSEATCIVGVFFKISGTWIKL